MFSMYKTVFIDWDGTLSSSKFWERWSIDPKHQPKYNMIQKVLFQNADNLVQSWMLGYCSTTSVVSYLANTTGLSYGELIKELRYSCEHMKFIDKSAIDIIQDIRKKGIKVVLATDNMDTFRHWTMPALDINDLFDGVLISDSIGALKSQCDDNGTSLFFHHYISQNNHQPGETVLIDNSVNNKVIEKFGIDFMHVDSEHSLIDRLKQLL